MKVSVVSRVYNERYLINEFLDYYREIVTKDGGKFYFYDDGSTDGTLEILQKDPDCVVVAGTRESGVMSHNNQRPQRRMMMDLACKDLGENDYILLLDIDEFLTFNQPIETITQDLVYFDLFDFYITEEDKDLHWSKREYVGPERRHIAFMVRKGAYKTVVADRTLVTTGGPVLHEGGFVKHMGKAVSIEYWENKCSHYASPGMPEKYRGKWEARKGKAIHTVSDFNTPLYKWDDIITKKDLWITIG